MLGVVDGPPSVLAAPPRPPTARQHRRVRERADRRAAATAPPSTPAIGIDDQPRRISSPSPTPSRPTTPTPLQTPCVDGIRRRHAHRRQPGDSPAAAANLGIEQVGVRSPPPTAQSDDRDQGSAVGAPRRRCQRRRRRQRRSRALSRRRRRHRHGTGTRRRHHRKRRRHLLQGDFTGISASQPPFRGKRCINIRQNPLQRWLPSPTKRTRHPHRRRRRVPSPRRLSAPAHRIIAAAAAMGLCPASAAHGNALRLRGTNNYPRTPHQTANHAHRLGTTLYRGRAALATRTLSRQRVVRGLIALVGQRVATRPMAHRHWWP